MFAPFALKPFSSVESSTFLSFSGKSPPRNGVAQFRFLADDARLHVTLFSRQGMRTCVLANRAPRDRAACTEEKTVRNSTSARLRERRAKLHHMITVSSSALLIHFFIEDMF